MMGNSMSCFDRWGKRTPDGALFIPKKVLNEPSKSGSAFSAPLAPNSPSASTAGTAGPAKPKVCRLILMMLTSLTLASSRDRLAHCESIKASDVEGIGLCAASCAASCVASWAVGCCEGWRG